MSICHHSRFHYSHMERSMKCTASVIFHWKEDSSKWMISYDHIYTWHVADVSHPLPILPAHSKQNLFRHPQVGSASLGSCIWPGPVGHLGEQALITRAWWMDRWILGNRHNAHHIDASQLKEKWNLSIALLDIIVYAKSEVEKWKAGCILV